jgi:hypothetical protein
MILTMFVYWFATGKPMYRSEARGQSIAYVSSCSNWRTTDISSDTYPTLALKH